MHSSGHRAGGHRQIVFTNPFNAAGEIEVAPPWDRQPGHLAHLPLHFGSGNQRLPVSESAQRRNPLASLQRRPEHPQSKQRVESR